MRRNESVLGKSYAKVKLSCVLAAFVDADECARILIERGANVNARDSEGKTPVMWALLRSSMKTLSTHQLVFIYLKI
jgi:hypothetical protein